MIAVINQKEPSPNFPVWIIGVPLAFLGALVFKLPVYYVFLMVHIEEIVKASIGILRITSKKWVTNVIHDM